jgi:hypothetical protein
MGMKYDGSRYADENGVYSHDGITAKTETYDHGRWVQVSDFEIDEEKIMNFGETAYIDAVARFVEYLRSLQTKEILIEPMRSGYQMLLARFGFEMVKDCASRQGFMHWDSSMPRTPSQAAHTFNRISGSSFEPHLKVRMEDGSEMPIGDLDIGLRVAGGGMVMGILTGRQRMGMLLGEHRFSASGAVQINGEWIRMEDHPDAQLLFDEDGWVGRAIKTEHHVLIVEGYLFADFVESEARAQGMREMSDQAIGLMNAEHANG